MSTENTQSLKNPNGKGQGKVKKRFNQIEDFEKQKVINYLYRGLKDAETFAEAEEALRHTLAFVRHVKADKLYCEHNPHNTPIYENF